jgi:hypothetical protein
MLCIQFNFILRLKESIKELDEEEEELVTPRLEMGSNDVNNTPREISYAQSIQHRSPRDN